MTYNPLLSTEIEVGDFAVQELWDKIKQNFDHFNGLIGGLEALDVYNGSFEIDADGDGIPDGWTVNLYAGGSMSLINSSLSLHGGKTVKFTHPGGAGNGGGYITSDYVPVNARGMLLGIDLNFTVVMHRKVELLRYDYAKALLGTDTPYDLSTGTINGRLVLPVNVGSTTRFIKIRIHAGLTDVEATGDAYLDNVSFNPLRASCFDGAGTISEQSTTSASFVDVGSPIVIGQGGLLHGVPVTYSFPAELKSSGTQETVMRWKIGSDFSNEAAVYGANYLTAPFLLKTTTSSVGSPNGTLALQMQLKTASGTGFGRKPHDKTLGCVMS
jgi:hypothetical protein